MRRFALLAAGVLVAITGLAYGISFVWPRYDWDLKVPSPDGQYSLVVLLCDAAAFADFCYHIYLFPRALTPPEQVRHSRVWYTPIWRGRKYLVYSGFSHPMFRWTSSHTIEIDLHEAEYEPFDVVSVKRIETTNDVIPTSVVFVREDSANALP